MIDAFENGLRLATHDVAPEGEIGQVQAALRSHHGDAKGAIMMPPDADLERSRRRDGARGTPTATIEDGPALMALLRAHNLLHTMSPAAMAPIAMAFDHDSGRSVQAPDRAGWGPWPTQVVVKDSKFDDSALFGPQRQGLAASFGSLSAAGGSLGLFRDEIWRHASGPEMAGVQAHVLSPAGAASAIWHGVEAVGLPASGPLTSPGASDARVAAAMDGLSFLVPSSQVGDHPDESLLAQVPMPDSAMLPMVAGLGAVRGVTGAGAVSGWPREARDSILPALPSAMPMPSPMISDVAGAGVPALSWLASRAVEPMGSIRPPTDVDAPLGQVGVSPVERDLAATPDSSPKADHSRVQVHTDVHLDGNVIAHAVTERIVAAFNGPLAGTGSFDGRRSYTPVEG